MNNKSDTSYVGTGLLTILTVLLVLVLSIFSILTYISARADLSLSRTNADTVSAYYTADTQAMHMVQEFAAGTEEDLKAEFPMTGRQSLSIHVVRGEDSSLKILSWNVVSSSSEGINIPD